MLKAPAATTTTVPGTGLTRDRHWRAGHLGPTLLLIGAIFWLIGSALISGAEKRFASTLVPVAGSPFPTLTSGAVFTSSYKAGTILWIIGSCFWILASLVMLSSAYIQAAIVTIGARPGLATLSIMAAWIQLISTILILIGSAIMTGGTLSTAGSGAIVLLCGFVLWTMAVLFNFAVSYVISTVVALMTTPFQKQYTWGSTTSLVVMLIALILYIVGTIALVCRDPPGFFYIGAIIHLIASTYMVFGTYILSSESYGNYTSIMSFATAIPIATTVGAGALAGGAMGATAAKGMGPGTGMGGTAMTGGMPGTIGSTTTGTMPGTMGSTTTGTMPGTVGSTTTTGGMGGPVL